MKNEAASQGEVCRLLARLRRYEKAAALIENLPAQ